MDASVLAALAHKYARLIALRRDTASGALTPRSVSVAMRALAADFPGALRELDGLSDAALVARRDAVERARQGAAREPWILPMARYHALLRAALAAKRAANASPHAPARASAANAAQNAGSSGPTSLGARGAYELEPPPPARELEPPLPTRELEPPTRGLEPPPPTRELEPPARELEPPPPARERPAGGRLSAAVARTVEAELSLTPGTLLPLLFPRAPAPR